MDREEMSKLAVTDIESRLHADDVEKALSSAPFVPVPQALNLRDLGLSASPHITPGLIYRSGALTAWPHSSQKLLVSQLNIKKIFDLRSERERQRAPSPVIEGLETRWMSPITPPTQPTLERFIGPKRTAAFADMYEEVATYHAPTFAAVMRHLAGAEAEPILFHCTAGKDRTGVLAALLLSLAGCPTETIAGDYSLTRIGIEADRDRLTSIMKSSFGNITFDTPGFKELSCCDGEYILAFLQRIGEKYGSVEGYCHEVLGLSKEEIEQIRSNILISN